MPYSRLRVVYGSEDGYESTSFAPASATKNMVTLPLADVLPLLADAVQSRRTWLRDFSDDEVTISSDLYEVLMAYRHLRRPSA